MQRLPIADAHCDFLYYMVTDGWDIKKSVPRQAVALPYMKESNAKLVFFAAWIDGDMKRNCLQQAMDLLDGYHTMMDANPDFVPLTKDFDPNGDKIATVLTVEGGEGINGEAANLRLFHRLGVRAMNLTWNFTNELASPAMRRANKGLTDRGREIVREMNRLGMAVDVSHLSDAGIDELLTLSERPIFASHSNMRSICSQKRCLKDEHVKAIAEMGGVVGINYYPNHLSDAGTACIEDIVRHIAYGAELVGPEHICLGSDFDGMTHYPEDMKTWRDVPNLLEALTKAGFSEDEVRRIAYQNLYDYIIQFC